MNKLLFIINLIPCVFAQFDNSQYVKLIDHADLIKVIQDDGDELWMVQFFNRETALAPEVKSFERAAKALAGHVNSVAINIASASNRLIPFVYGIDTFPSVIVFPYYKRNYKILTYETESEIIKEVGQMLDLHFQDRGSEKYVDTKLNIELIKKDADSVDKFLNDTIAEWATVYYDLTCTECINLKPIWKKVINELHEKVQFSSVNSMKQLFSLEDIKYPIVKYYPRKGRPAITYEGNLNAEDITKFIEKQLWNPKVNEILKDETIQRCAKRRYCIITFLPDDEFCDFKCIKKAVGLLKDMGKKYKKRSWAFLWTQYDKQMSISSYFNLERETVVPTMILVNMIEAKYQQVPFKAQLTQLDITNVAEKIITNTGFDTPLLLEHLPQVYEVAPVLGLSKGIKDEL